MARRLRESSAVSDVVVARLEGTPADGEVEIVERKGVGHPDTICDALAERFSLALSRYTRERFGVILHHNVDKALLVAGTGRPAFGGGTVLEPFEVILAGRATTVAGSEVVPVEMLAQDACRQWLERNLHALDPTRHARVRTLVRPGSADLVGLFQRPGRAAVPLANDTSIGVGFAPLTDLERVVLAVERALNHPATKHAHPELGEDVKVMGIRRGRRIDLTVACAFVDRFVSSVEDYRTKKEAAARLAAEVAGRTSALATEVVLNGADDLERGDLFLTVTGTSAESGDDGEVGRGNRVNGLITPYRPMSLEAAAGKNPVSHVGKLYNVAAHRIAAAIVERVDAATAAYCYLVSRIGRPITEPLVADVRLACRGGVGEPATAVERIVREQLEALPRLSDEILASEVDVY